MTDSISVADRQVGETAVTATSDVETELRPGSLHRQVVRVASFEGVGDGTKTVTSAGTREQLAVDTPCLKVRITAKITNTGHIYIGGSTVDSTRGEILFPTQKAEFEVSNLNLLYLDAQNNGEGVTYIYFTS